MESGIEEANEERLEISENIFIGKAHSPKMIWITNVCLSFDQLSISQTKLYWKFWQIVTKRWFQ